MLTEKQKEYLVLGTAFITEYNEDQPTDSDIKELLQFLGQQCNLYIKNKDNVIKYTESAYVKLFDLTEGKDVTANLLCLAVGFVMLLLEEDVFKGSNLLKVKRLTNSIFNKLEQSQKLETLMTTNKLVAKFKDLN